LPLLYLINTYTRNSVLLDQLYKYLASAQLILIATKLQDSLSPVNNSPAYKDDTKLLAKHNSEAKSTLLTTLYLFTCGTALTASLPHYEYTACLTELQTSLSLAENRSHFDNIHDNMIIDHLSQLLQDQFHNKTLKPKIKSDFEFYQAYLNGKNKNDLNDTDDSLSIFLGKNLSKEASDEILEESLACVKTCM